MMSIPTILALDFDGVICDGLIEYFQTAWRTYCQIWSPSSQTPPENLALSFYKLRPVIETGWEMPVLIRALMLGMSEEKILQEWGALAQSILLQSDLQSRDIAIKLDQLRDRAIASDLNGWLSLHRFYPGVVEKLREIPTSQVELFIVTTKEARFVQQLLQQHSIQLPETSIFGKDRKRPKYEIIRELISVATDKSVSLWFVEDRLQTLQLVIQQSDLDMVKLYLADWGYNTPSERQAAQEDPRIGVLSLSQFAQDFSDWS